MYKTDKNYYIIAQDFFRYLPSRFYVLTNILLIIPLFSKMLSVKEMGIFQLGISILNLICTILFDWISKSALRFYEESKLKCMMCEFMNNIFALFFINYLILIFLYFKFRHYICSTFYINEITLASIMIIVMPCIIRQFLYQILRLLNRPVMYTVSIVAYQIMLVFITLILIKGGTDNVAAIFIAMAVTISLIDIYILRTIKIKTNIKFSLCDISYIKKYLIYGIPLVCTNFAIWSFYHFNKYYFQRLGDFTATGELSLAYFIVSSILTSIFSTLLFAVFPRIIKRFETNRPINKLMTSLTQLYFIFFLPLTLMFCFYSSEILDIFTKNQYKETVCLLPFFAVSIFMHELCKIINIKYHLKNLTIIETIITVLTGILCIIFNLYFIKLYGITGSVIAMTLSFALLIMFNTLIRFKSILYINYAKVFNSFLTATVLCIIAYYVSSPIGDIATAPVISQAVKIVVFLGFYYAMAGLFFRAILR